MRALARWESSSPPGRASAFFCGPALFGRRGDDVHPDAHDSQEDRTCKKQGGNRLLWHYAKGKPKELFEHSGQVNIGRIVDEIHMEEHPDRKKRR